MELFVFEDLDEDAQQVAMDALEGEITPSVSELCANLHVEFAQMEKTLGIVSYSFNAGDLNSTLPSVQILDLKREENLNWEEDLAQYFSYDMEMREIANLFAAEEDPEAIKQLEEWIFIALYSELYEQTSKEKLENHINDQAYLFHSDGRIYTGKEN